MGASFLCQLLLVKVFSFYFQVEDAVSRAADGTSLVQEGNLGSLRLQLGPLAAVSMKCLYTL